jgi:hypothetical protein
MTITFLRLRKMPEHAEHEQDRADDDEVFDADHSETPCPTSGLVLTVASLGLRAICFEMFCCPRGARARGGSARSRRSSPPAG